ncbi:MAG: UvrD-helicase domain-containing protein [Candidatus Riflebacteria bacterium]|nr:UvrD-helicase domain-containing protein [Candidatus Riflebacteria bacterium]
MTLVNGVNNVIVSASAGSGKTFELSMRFISLIYHHADPAAILATTFTKKAAGEILERILQKISEAVINEKKAIELANFIKIRNRDFLKPSDLQMIFLSLLKRMRDSLHRLSITTMDGFFSGIVGSFPFELGMTAEMNLTEEDSPIAKKLYSDALKEMFLRLPTDETISQIKKIYRGKLKRSIFEMFLEKIESAFPIYRSTSDPRLWEMVKFDESQILGVDQFDHFIKEWENIGNLSSFEGNTVLVEAHAKIKEFLKDQNWPAFLKHTLVCNSFKDPPKYFRKLIPNEVCELVSKVYSHAKNSLLRQLFEENKYFGKFLEDFERVFEEIKRKHNLTFFGDIPLAIMRTIDLESDLALNEFYFRLDGRIQHMFLDEFQDTSISQWSIFQPLASEICATGDPTKMNRSLFLVGDPKQSIYGWRDGCPELFGNVIDDPEIFIRIEKMWMSYRSKPAIIETVNRVFKNIAINPGITKDYLKRVVEEFSSFFDEHVSHDHEHGSGWVELRSSKTVEISEVSETTNSDDDSESSSEPQEQFSSHYQFCAKEIQKLHLEFPGKQIGVLVRTNRLVKQMIFHLRELGVSASGEGKNPLDDEAAVLAVLAALKLGDNPGDSIAAFHLMATPLGKYLGLNQKSDSAAVSLEIRNQICSDGLQKTLTNWTRYIAPLEVERTLDRLLQLIKIAGEFDYTKSTGLSDFIDFVRGSRVEQVEVAPVRVMTIHGSKGLGFDIVVLPELNFNFFKTFRDPIYVRREHPISPPTGFFNAVGKDFRNHSPEISEAYDQQVKRRYRDIICGLYVAMTRAKEGLLMITEPLEKRKNGEWKVKGWADDSYAAILRRALSSEPTENEWFKPIFQCGAKEVVLNAEKQSDSFDSANQILSETDSELSDIETPLKTPDSSKGATSSTAFRNEITKQIPSVSFRKLVPDEKPFRSFHVLNPSGTDEFAWSQFLNIESNYLKSLEYGKIVHFILGQIEWIPDENNDFLKVIYDTQLQDSDSSAFFEKLLASYFPEAKNEVIRRALVSVKNLISSGKSREIFELPKEADFRLFREQSFSVKTQDGLMNGIFDRAILFYEDSKPFKASIWEFKTGRPANRKVSEGHENSGNPEDSSARPLEKIDFSEKRAAELEKKYQKQIYMYKTAFSSMTGLPCEKIESSLVYIDYFR